MARARRATSNDAASRRTWAANDALGTVDSAQSLGVKVVEVHVIRVPHNVLQR